LGLIAMRVIADGNNEMGDTLTRLAVDLFHTLGYENCRINVHKTGRELDIKAEHAYEKRTLIAECKAHRSPIGGSDINKFVGVLDAERRLLTGQREVVGYFVSVSGFRETAREQELEIGGGRVQLIDGDQIVERIVRSNIVIAPEKAAEAAGRFYSSIGVEAELRRIDLIAHPLGWLWGVYFSQGSDEAKSACLIYADGQIVPNSVAAKFNIPNVQILAPPDYHPAERERIISQIYLEHIINEYGVITLEGLPVDREVGSRSFQLEDLYIPLQLLEAQSNETVNPESTEDTDQSAIAADGDADADAKISLGTALSLKQNVSVLGPPGSGKSTLIKRLAVAYAEHSRLNDSQDDLPGEDWFPIVVRCRHVSDLADQPFHAILEASISWTERSDLIPDFMSFLGILLPAGRVLLLVDGLDEIANTSMRARFIGQLRTFLSRYPQTRLVMTSREVGFRQIAGSVYSMCMPYKVAELDDDAIRELVLAWHRQVMGNEPSVLERAYNLVDVITSNDRVTRLAGNPLLLTTLLLVQRWAGQLPRKRTILYQKAIEVLLMTWNVEGHEPMDLDEALPQLGYAAYHMMLSKETSISAGSLAALFRDARTEMPELLAYSRVSVQNFLSRVEERSSVLILSGYADIDGELSPVYEFKHLTFQEYLAAQAIVNRWVSTSEQAKSPAQLLAPVLHIPEWSEVVTLAAVLNGRGGAETVRNLMRFLHGRSSPNTSREVLWGNLLGCLSDDVPIAPDLAEEAIKSLLASPEPEEDRPGADGYMRTMQMCAQLKGGRYFETLKNVGYEACANDVEPVELWATLLERTAETEILESSLLNQAIIQLIDKNLLASSIGDRIWGTALLMNMAYRNDRSVSSLGNREPLSQTDARALRRSLDYIAQNLVAEGDIHNTFTFIQIWALAWGGPRLTRNKERISRLRAFLFQRWFESTDAELSRYTAWAFSTAPLVGDLSVSIDHKLRADFVRGAWQGRQPRSAMRLSSGNRVFKQSAIIAGVMFKDVWPRDTLCEMTIALYQRASEYDRKTLRAFARSILRTLGPEGAKYLKELD
jgi:hypothetical protein